MVGILKELHDELDAAVLQAYGWSDLATGNPTDTPELLQRLVALNARRATEEQAGTVRWLRPEFQNPAQMANEALLKTELLPHYPRALQADLMLETAKLGSEPAPWPATLPEQVRAVVQVLSSSPAPLTLEQIEARFKGKGGWKKGLPTLLETLEALGRAQRVDSQGATVWRA